MFLDLFQKSQSFRCFFRKDYLTSKRRDLRSTRDKSLGGAFVPDLLYCSMYQSSQLHGRVSAKLRCSDTEFAWY